MQTDTSYDVLLKSENCHSEVQLHDKSTTPRKLAKTEEAALLEYKDHQTPHGCILVQKGRQIM